MFGGTWPRCGLATGQLQCCQKVFWTRCCAKPAPRPAVQPAPSGSLTSWWQSVENEMIFFCEFLRIEVHVFEISRNLELQLWYIFWSSKFMLVCPNNARFKSCSNMEQVAIECDGCWFAYQKKVVAFHRFSRTFQPQRRPKITAASVIFETEGAKRSPYGRRNMTECPDRASRWPWLTSAAHVQFR